MKKLFLLSLLAIALAGCGSNHDSTGDQLSALNDQANVAADQGDVADAQIALDNDALNGGDLTADTLRLVRKLRTARSDGATDRYIGKQIDNAEDVVTDCSECIDLLENARS